MHSHRETGSKRQQTRFSQELRQLGEQFGDRRVQLVEILDATAGRGFNLLLVVISLPFLTPIPLPGFSMPFGLVVALIGARMAVGKKPWLPQRLLRQELPPRFLSAFLRAASSVLRGLEILLRPRLAFMNRNFIMRRMAGGAALALTSSVVERAARGAEPPHFHSPLHEGTGPVPSPIASGPRRHAWRARAHPRRFALTLTRRTVE